MWPNCPCISTGRRLLNPAVRAAAADLGLEHVPGIAEAKRALVDSAVIPENALSWLPDVMIYFQWLDK